MLYSITGLQCPGCGGLRAAHQLLHGHVAAAFALNPLVFVLAALAGAYGIAAVLRWWTGRDWLRPLRHPACWWLLAGLMVIFGLARNLPLATWAGF